MTFITSTQPGLRTRVLPRFPANVLAGAGITIVKSGNVYTFSADFNDIPLTGLADQATETILGRAAVGSGPPSAIPIAGGLAFTGGNLEISSNQRLRLVNQMIYQNGSVLTTGVKADLLIPYTGTIVGVHLLADQSGSVVVDLWKDTFANAPPTVADTITAAAKPTLSSALKARDQTLTGWTVGVTEGDVIRVNFDSVSTITRLQIGLEIRAA